MSPARSLKATIGRKACIRITTLGSFQLTVSGQPVLFARKAQRRPLTLLKALIALGGTNVLESRLTDALWPDSDGDAAHQALATTLHRLRKLLGQHRAIVLADRRFTLNPDLCWVDAWSFQHFAEQGGEMAGKRLSELRRKAIRLYQGLFLQDEDELWAAGLREELRTKYIRCVLSVCEDWSRMRKYKMAIVYLERALSIDSHVEPFYRQLIVNLHHLGRHSEAMAVYGQCVTRLYEKDRLPPSHELRALYAKIAP
jgi:DNA-binding SARP family transcriptional activator